MFLSAWLIFSAWCSLCGWGLSACGILNAWGYALAALLSLPLALKCLRATGAKPEIRSFLQLRRKLSRPLPAVFAALAFLALAGALLYPPNNADALSYRVPRMLHWWAEGRWYWIPTVDNRLNTRATGFEWLTMPLLIWTRTDRWLFAMNFLSFLFLPGLSFMFMRQLRISRKVAWCWMWILPCGYVYLLQAGSVANDAFSAVYALAAVALGLKAWREKSLPRAYLAAISAALLTNSKSSALPLLLCSTVALFPLWRMLAARPLQTAVVTVVCIVISFVPTALVNIIHTGDWTGYKAEGRLFMASNPLVGLAGNTLGIANQNLVPPFAPGAMSWGSACLKSLPAFFRKVLEDNFEDGFLEVREVVSEERAGYGLGNLVLLGISAAAAARVQTRKLPISTTTRVILLSAFVALIAFMAKSGVNAAGRLLAPYYLLLAPALLLNPNQAAIIRTHWWRSAALAVLGVAGLLLIFSPARPVWPALTVLAKANDIHPDRAPLQRAVTVHRLFRERPDALCELLLDLPDLQKLGVISYIADPVASLWRPFGSRRLYYLTPKDTAESIRANNLEYAVVAEEFFSTIFHQKIEDWLVQVRGTVVRERTLSLTYAHGAQRWLVVRFPPELGPARS